MENDQKHEEQNQQQEAEQRREGARGKPQDEPDFEAMSHEELMNYAREQGLEGLSSDMTDEEIAQMLRGEV